MDEAITYSLDTPVNNESISGFDAITKIVSNLFEMYGVEIEYSIKSILHGVELRIGTKNWRYDLAAYKGTSTQECIALLQYELTANETANSNLRRYIEKLPIFGELGALFSPNPMATEAVNKVFPKSLMALPLNKHASVIADIYEPNLLIQLLVRVANELEAANTKR